VAIGGPREGFVIAPDPGKNRRFGADGSIPVVLILCGDQCFAGVTDRHLGGMPHLHIAPSKWDTSMGTLAVIVLAVRRFLRHDLAAVD